MNPDSLERYRSLLAPAEMARLSAAIERPAPPAVRVNTLKVHPGHALPTWAERYGWVCRPVPFCATGWQIQSARQAPGKTLEHKSGCYYIQDAASMLPGEMFDFASDEWPVLLDMSAAPGGKTTHLVCRLHDRGLIVANDASIRRITPLRLNLQTWGALSVAVTCFPGERFGGWFGERFDAALVDAPCSGESLRTRSRAVSDTERRQLQRRQIELLTSAFRAVRPGGQIVYATCSLHPDEDEAVLDALLRLYPHQAEVEALELGLCAPGLAADGQRTFVPAVQHAVRLWPHLYDSDGFFAARVRKRDSVPVPPVPSPCRSLAEAGWEALGSRERGRIAEELRQAYDFDLEATLDQWRLALWRNGAAVYAIPTLFLSLFPALPCITLGLQVGEQSEGRFVPAHEWVSRFWPAFTAGRMALAGSQAGLWLAGRDLRGGWKTTDPAGAIILFEDDAGRFVGRGKLLRDRVRNLLPRQWVY